MLDRRARGRDRRASDRARHRRHRRGPRRAHRAAHARRVDDPDRGAARPRRPRPFRGGDARDHPRAVARRRMHGAAAGRLPAARSRRARRRALARMRPGRVGVVPDRHGTGTNALLLAPADAIGPAFGAGQRDAPPRPRRARPDTRWPPSGSSRWRSTSTPRRPRRARRRARRTPERAPAAAAALQGLGPITGQRE